MLSQQVWPINRAGEVSDFSRRGLILCTGVISIFLGYVYKGSYSADNAMTFDDMDWHYAKKWYIVFCTAFGLAHFIFATLITIFHIIAYSKWKVNTGLIAWRADNPGDNHLVDGMHPYGWMLTLQYFLDDSELLATMFWAFFSFMGLHYDFLFFSFHNVFVCMQQQTLSKVFDAVFERLVEVGGTVFLGFCFQYCFLVGGFMLFPIGYGFADMDTSGCQSLKECLLAHLDYGFRSAPVWFQGPELTMTQLVFDYAYNLFVILILSAIISGIIIDAFASKREDVKFKKQNQSELCFVCNFNRSSMERKMVNFEDHVVYQHYMWSYARFLMYLKEAEESSLNGPESYVRSMMFMQDYAFYPVYRALALDTGDEGDYEENPLRIKDLEELRALVGKCKEETDAIQQLERELKTGMKDTSESVKEMAMRLNSLQTEVEKKLATAQQSG